MIAVYCGAFGVKMKAAIISHDSVGDLQTPNCCKRKNPRLYAFVNVFDHWSAHEYIPMQHPLTIGVGHRYKSKDFLAGELSIARNFRIPALQSLLYDTLHL